GCLLPDTRNNRPPPQFGTVHAKGRRFALRNHNIRTQAREARLLRWCRLLHFRTPFREGNAQGLTQEATRLEEPALDRSGRAAHLLSNLCDASSFQIEPLRRFASRIR